MPLSWQRHLAIPTVIVPAYPGTLSALGFLAADVRLDFALSEPQRSDEAGIADRLLDGFRRLEAAASKHLREDADIDDGSVIFERSCDVRYIGQAYEVNVPVQAPKHEPEALLGQFHARHQSAYGFSSAGDPCEIVTLRVWARVPLERPPLDVTRKTHGTTARQTTQDVYLTGRGVVSVAAYERHELPCGTIIEGPAVLQQQDATTFLPGGAVAVADALGALIVTVTPDAG
jgi:N-methylhydantoinase A